MPLSYFQIKLHYYSWQTFIVCLTSQIEKSINVSVELWALKDIAGRRLMKELMLLSIQPYRDKLHLTSSVVIRFWLRLILCWLSEPYMFSAAVKQKYSVFSTNKGGDFTILFM
jgi:hypothetical protein